MESQFHIRMSEEDKEIMRRAASMVGMSLSDFARKLIVTRSIEILAYQAGYRTKEEVLEDCKTSDSNLLNSVDVRAAGKTK